MKKIKKYSAVLLSAVLALTGTPPFFAAAASDSPVTDMTAFYQNWKTRYVRQDLYTADEIRYYVYYSEATYTGGDPVPVTVSEAHGYGMLIAVSMADYDSEAKDLFDGMVRYYLAHPSQIGSHLMAWQQSDTGSALTETDGADSATDGDMDIAYALLLADKVWGSSGSFDYGAMGKAVLEDIMTYEVDQTAWTLSLGDWTYGSSGSKYDGATRASDFILQYLPVFAKVTGDERWTKVYDRTNAIVTDMVDTYGTGLLPDFLIPDGSGGYQPAPENYLEDVTDGQYGYNSCRVPWRVGMDAENNPAARKCIDALNQFIRKQTGGDPWEIRAGYTLDGKPTADYNDLCFTAPFLVAAKYSDDSTWTEELRDCVVNYGDDTYFGDTIKMLCLIVYADQWQVPDTGADTLRGDVNLDGSVNMQDMVLLLRYLLHAEPLSKEQAVQADLYADGTVNGLDLCRLRQILGNTV